MAELDSSTPRGEFETPAERCPIVEQEVKVEQDREKEEGTMKPWEQHSAVISIPRFDYNAPATLLQHSHCGFLVTCPIKREKSATKEVMSIFEKHIGSVNSHNSQRIESLVANWDSKRRKIDVEDVERDCPQSLSTSDSSGVSESSKSVGKISDLSLVKMTRSGLLLFTFPKDNSPAVVDVVSNIIQSLESGTLGSPLWCHRILPFQATCILDEKEIRSVVSKLVKQFVTHNQNKIARPLKFAVGYNRRGVEETQTKAAHHVTQDSPKTSTMLDRNRCFTTVAAAVKDVVPDSSVDLKCPEVAVLIELLPLFGIPETSPLVAVSVIPQNLICTKPRLCIRALVTDTKTKKGNKAQP